MSDKKHLSASQLGMYLKCPRQWRFRYVDGLIRPPGCALTLGKAFHSAVEVNYKQKVETKKDVPVDVMTDAFVDEFKTRVKEDGTEFDTDKGETPAGIQDLGVKLVGVQRVEIAPKVQPVAVEETFEVSLGDEFPYTLKGIIDGITADGVIFDNKTGGKNIPQSDIDGDIQLTAYALGYRIMHQTPERALELHRVVKTKEPKTQVLRTTRTNEDLKWFLGMVEEIAKGLTAGAFPPNPTGWWCSEKFCGYWNECRAKGGTS